MLGRPVLMSIAAAIGSLLSVTGASASCYSCGCSAPPVYSYSYAMPCATYAAPPMYIVNQGPAYTLPVPIAAEPTPAYSYPYVGRPQAYYGDDEQQYEVYPRSYRRHHWRQSYGYDRYQDRGFRLDRGYRHHSRPYIGMRHHHRFAHIPRAHMHMQRQFHHMQMRQHMHMRHQMHMRPHMQHMRGPAPGFVHPQKKH